MGGSTGIATAIQGGHVAWIVPEYKNGLPLWRWLRSVLANIERRGGCRIRQAERIIEFPLSGGFIGIFSAKNADAIRGWAFHYVVVDEAAKIMESVWEEVLLPTLADHDGSALLISSPAGKNWLYRQYLQGLQAGSGVKSWMHPTNANPLPNIQRAFALVKERVERGDYLRRVFEQEWLAMFIDDFGGVFENVRACASGIQIEEPERHHRYAIGADWGKHDDYTVLLVRDIDEHRVVHFQRSNGLSYTIQKERLRNLMGRFDPEITVAERNSMGEPIIDDLQSEGFKIVPFHTDNASKKKGVDLMALEFAKKDRTIMADERAIAEYENFSARRTLNGLTRFEAANGFHDDIVMADLFATWGSYEVEGKTMTMEDAEYLERLLA